MEKKYPQKQKQQQRKIKINKKMFTCIVALAMGLDEKKKIGWDDGREIYI